MDRIFSQHFPGLVNIAEKKTSDATSQYNCIAWAFEDNLRHWWPNKKRSHWPLVVDGKSDIEAFEEWFEHDGWTRTDNAEVEVGFKKVVLFLLNGAPTHAARLLPNGLWTSKLGPQIDISHSLEELNGPTYGSPCLIFRKPT